MRSLIKQLVGDTATYGASDILLKVIGFLTVPIITRLLTLADFAILELLANFVTFAIPLVIMGMDFALPSFYLDKEVAPNELQRGRLLSTCLWTLLGWGCFLLILCALASPYISSIVFDGKLDIGLIYLAIFVTFGSLLWWFGRYILRLNFKARLFAILSIVTIIFNAIAGIFVLTVLHWSVRGYYAVNGVTITLGGLAGLYLIRKEIHLEFDFSLAWRMLRMGIPFIPATVIYVAMTLLDRLILNYFAPLDQVGLYSIATKVVSIIAMAVTMFSMAWSPLAVKTYYDSPDGYSFFYRQMLIYVLAVFGLLAIGLTMVAPVILWVLAPKEYAPAVVAVGPLALSAVALAANQITTLGPVLKRKPIYGPLLAVFAAGVNIALCLVLIPRWGIIGAAWSIAVAQTSLTILGGVVTERLLAPFRYERRQTLWQSAAILIGIILIGLQKTSSPATEVLLNLAILLAYLASLWKLGVFNKDHISQAYAWARGLRGLRPGA